MSAEMLLQYFERVSEAPDAIARLRQFILDLAVRGKLVAQDPADEPAAELLERIYARKAAVKKVAPKVEAQVLKFELPSGWISASFGDVFSLEYGDNLPAEKRSNTGEFPVYGSNGIVGSHSECFVRSPCIVVGRKGSAGALNLSLARGCCVTDVAYYCVPPKEIDLFFAFRMFHTLRLESLGKGVKPGLSRGEVYDLPIAIPPIAEQRRIAIKVDELMVLCDQLANAKAEREESRDRLVVASVQRLNESGSEDSLREHADFVFNNLDRLITRGGHIKKLREAILNLAVRGKLVVQDTRDGSAADLFKKIQSEKAVLVKGRLIPNSKVRVGVPKLPFDIPSSWVAIRFGDVCNLVTSGSRGWAEHYAKSGPKFIRAQNIRFGKLRLDDLACVNLPSKTEGRRTKISEGDLLVVITGAGVTNPALMDCDLGEAYVSQHVALIKPTTTALSKWLLLCLMAGAGGRDELIARAYGAGKPGLNLDNIRTLSMPLPPFAEQERIIAKVDELMTLCDQLEVQLANAENDRVRLLEAVLHQTLTAPALTEAA